MRYRQCRCGETVDETFTTCPSCMTDVSARPLMTNRIAAQAPAADSAPSASPPAGPPPMPAPPVWYYAVGAERVGPCTFNDLIRSLRSGQLSLKTLVWTPGMEQWGSAGEVPDIVRAVPPVVEPEPPQESPRPALREPLQPQRIDDDVSSLDGNGGRASGNGNPPLDAAGPGAGTVPLQGKPLVCPQCDTPLRTTDVFCVGCGNPVGDVVAAGNALAPEPDGNGSTRRAQAGGISGMAAPAGRYEQCPVCQRHASPTDRFCVGCGFDLGVPAPLSSAGAIAAATAIASVSPNAQAWRRWFARMVDYAIAAFMLGMIIELIVPGSTLFDGIFGEMIIFASWIVGEAFIMSGFGRTPGKTLLNIRVTQADGSKLTLEQAIGRAARVWLFGIGLGLPIINLITMILSYQKLTKEGTTSWDREGDFAVSYGELRLDRIVGIAIAAVLIVAAVVLGSVL